MTIVSESPLKTVLFYTAILIMLVYGNNISLCHCVRFLTKGIKKMVTMLTNQNTEKTLTLVAEELHNPALMLAAMLRQGIRVNADSPIAALGGGRYNPALIIFQTVKHMATDEQIEALIKRESVLSDYYSLLRNNDVKKDIINDRVDSARQVYVETGKHSAQVMKMLAGIADEQITESNRQTRNQRKAGNSPQPFNGNDTRTSSPLTSKVYTVNDSPTLMVKVTKLLESGDVRVAMVKGDVLPQGSRVNLDGVGASYVVKSIVGKNMTLTVKSLAERVKESTPVAAKTSAKTQGRVASMKTPKESYNDSVLTTALASMDSESLKALLLKALTQ